LSDFQGAPCNTFNPKDQDSQSDRERQAQNFPTRVFDPDKPRCLLTQPRTQLRAPPAILSMKAFHRSCGLIDEVNNV